MSSNGSFARLARLVFASFIGGVTFAAVPAGAGGLYQEQVHADSFGNLVIYSPGGYKRIVVGKGYLADEMGGYEPEVVYLEDGYAVDRVRPCERQGVLLHGRSYMYGLPDNVTPVLSACR